MSGSLFANVKQDLCGALAEFVGTFIFLSLAFGGVQATSSAGIVDPSTPVILDVFIASANFGFSLLAAVWMFYRVSGANFNPNVTLGLFLTGCIGPVRFALYCIAQLAGAIAAAAAVLALSPDPCGYNTSLRKGINPAQGVFIEMFVTAYLVLAVLMLAAEKHRATPFAPIGIGLTLFVGEMWSIYYTGGAVNTARAFGPAVVTGFPQGSHWVYWVGPCLGSILASAVYRALKYWDYLAINPGQDDTSHGNAHAHAHDDDGGQTTPINERPRTLTKTHDSAGRMSADV